jgi:hypothetical protein
VTRWGVVVTLLAALAAPALAACGDDDSGETAGEAREDPPVSAPAAEGVTLTATLHRDGRRVRFDYMLANPGPDPAAVVDPTSVVEALEIPDGGGMRARYLRPTGDPAGGAPLPELSGLIVPAGGERTGTGAITGQFEELPDTLTICIEVVPRPWRDEGGVARFPYGAPGGEPALTCTGELALGPG